MYIVLNYIRPFEGNHEADVAPGENEFDIPVLEVLSGVELQLMTVTACSSHDTVLVYSSLRLTYPHLYCASWGHH